MSCPTCDHTLEGIGHGMFHCPRCGTLINCPADGAIHVPALVARCRMFEPRLQDLCKSIVESWCRLGIEESIHTAKEKDNARLTQELVPSE
jgi:hypothetical protein